MNFKGILATLVVMAAVAAGARVDSIDNHHRTARQTRDTGLYFLDTRVYDPAYINQACLTLNNSCVQDVRSLGHQWTRAQIRCCTNSPVLPSDADRDFFAQYVSCIGLSASRPYDYCKAIVYKDVCINPLYPNNGGFQFCPTTDTPYPQIDDKTTSYADRYWKCINDDCARVSSNPTKQANCFQSCKTYYCCDYRCASVHPGYYANCSGYPDFKEHYPTYALP